MASPKKSVLITGCSAGGIGAALAEVFHEKGYHVFATARNPSNISESLSSAADVTILTLDVLSSESIAASVESVKRQTGGTLDVLVNNSGGGSYLPALDCSIEEGKKLFDLNFWAPLVMLQAFAPLLIKAKGCIVNNTSCNAYLPLGFMSKCPILLQLFANKPGIYNASKAALATASETWRHELEPLGVRTVTLVTCAVKSNAFNDFHGPELPETSNYNRIRDFIHTLTDGSLQATAISSRQYATKVVREIDTGAVGKVWAGTHAFSSRILLWLAPQSLLVNFGSSPVFDRYLMDTAGHVNRECYSCL
jgi:1-acylglycerone phosphate reductase